MNTTMNQVDSPRLHQLESISLPNIPTGTSYLLQSLTDENLDFINLSSIVENFPGIAARMISLANSAWSAPSIVITSLEDSCARLGLAVVRSTAIALALASPFNARKCPGFDQVYFWYGALMASDIASRLVSVSPATDLEPSSARAAGLLHNLGLLWLADQLPVEVNEALTLTSQDRFETLQLSLSNALGFDHVNAGGYLAKRWNLPEPLVKAMKYYADPNYKGCQYQMVNTVGLAARMMSAQLNNRPCPTGCNRQSQLGITDENLVAVFEQSNSQMDKLQATAKALF